MKRYAIFLALVLPGTTALAATSQSFDWPQWQGPDRNAVSKEARPPQRVAERRPAAGLEDQGARRGLQRPLHRRRADLRHEQPRRRRSRLGTLREGRQGAVGNAAWAGLPPGARRRETRGRDARRRSMATCSTSRAWAAM